MKNVHPIQRTSYEDEFVPSNEVAVLLIHADGDFLHPPAELDLAMRGLRMRRHLSGARSLIRITRREQQEIYARYSQHSDLYDEKIT